MAGSIREGLSYDDVLLVPQLGILDHREDADVSARFVDGIDLRVPFVSAPMDSVTDVEMAAAIFDTGGLGVLHRFCTIAEQVEMYRRVLLYDAICACAIGVHDGLERTARLGQFDCKLFVLDVAHAHTDAVIEFVREWLSRFTEAKLVVGNIATAEAAQVFDSLGVHGLKVGIGPGAACSTRAVTGFGVPQLTAIMDVRTVTDLPIIADGGIKSSGDVVKALAVGADTVMLGRLLAGADESPHPGLYWGMASKRVNGHHAPEGVEGSVLLTGSVRNTIRELAWGLRSGVSYAGATNLQELRQNAEFIRVTSLSQTESGTRI